uniref:Uncharacterized protein n=1 Tax=Meloidogyne hapla TaxID=6305 RepID=A0A1I8B655_MELHA
MLSDYPMPISIVNFFSSESVGHSLKKHLHFLFGPPEVSNAHELDIPPEIINANLYSKLDYFLDKEDGKINFNKENIYKYEPHPFIPEITTKGILDVCERDGIKKEEIAYISSSATQYLPDDPKIIKERFKAFVLSPLEDGHNPRQRPSFRPPTFMPPSAYIELLRVIISGRTESWDWAIDNRVPKLRIQDLYSLPNPWKDPSGVRISPENFAKIKSRRAENLNLIKAALIKLQNKKNYLKSTKQQQKYSSQQDNNKLITQAMTNKIIKKRKYSREVKLI